MSTTAFDEDDVEQRIDALDHKRRDLSSRCHFRSASRVAAEIRRVAKEHRRVVDYMDATFQVMNGSSELLEPHIGREMAIALISLVENEDRARAIQPNLPEGDYANAVRWMTACAYDKLATAYGDLHGYNSEGMHACIAEGIQVCRRTGKLQCIACFQEYATDVYEAADDLDMAMHFARSGMARERGEGDDRRWAGAYKLAYLLELTGHISSAEEAAVRAWNLVPTWLSPRRILLKTRLLLDELAHLFGDPSRWTKLTLPSDGDGKVELGWCDDPPSTGEFVALELHRDQVEAIAACCGGDYEHAITLLMKWDRDLSRRGCLSKWFRNRLQLLAVHQLAGRDRDLDRLAQQLDDKARAARDWLTLP